MANTIITEIELDLKKIKDGLKKSEGISKKGGAKSGKKFGNAFEKRFGNLSAGLSKKFLALAAVAAAAFGGRAIIQAASRQEDAINGLNAALRAAGQFTQATSKDLQQFAADLQKVTTTGDETILELLALGQAFGFTAEQSKIAAQASLELAAAARINVVEAMRRVGRTISGSVADVSKFASGINNLTKQQLAAGEAATLLVKSLSGTAAAQTKTFSGIVAQLSNSFGDLLEEMGFFITKNPLVLASFGLLKDIVESLGTALKAVRVGVFQLQNAFVAMGIIIVGSLELISRVFGTVFTESLKSVRSQLQGLLFDFNDLADGADQSIKKITASTEGISFQNIADAFSSTANQIKFTAQSLGKILQTTFVTGFSSAFASFGGALAKGENAFEAFGKAILKSIGQLLITFGQMLIAIGIGLSAVPFLFGLQGPSAVAAGVVATVLGGAILALAGGGAAPVASAGGGIASTGGGGLEVPSLDVGQVLPDQDREVGTQVVVNIAGNVLDRRETGLEIVEIINEAFGSDGVRIAEVGA